MELTDSGRLSRPATQRIFLSWLLKTKITDTYYWNQNSGSHAMWQALLLTELTISPVCMCVCVCIYIFCICKKRCGICLSESGLFHIIQWFPVTIYFFAKVMIFLCDCIKSSCDVRDRIFLKHCSFSPHPIFLYVCLHVCMHVGMYEEATCACVLVHVHMLM